MDSTRRAYQDSDSAGTGSGRSAEETIQPVLIWDLPTRVFHWTLVASFFLAFVTSGPDRYRDIHVYSGYVVLGLIGFRIVWGFVGSRYARFASFLFSPRAATAYVADLLRARARRYLGHNPPGSLAIYAMLVLGLLVCVSGVMVLGTEESQGLLKHLADQPLGESLRRLHDALSWLMLALVVVHVTGVVVESRAHRENLAKAMVTGRKDAATEAGIAAAHPLVAGAILVAVAGGAVWGLHWRLIDIPGLEHLPYVGKRLPDNATWRARCGTCHVPYHPTLLPARSWNALLDRPDNHFGVSWGFDARTLAEIRGFLLKHSAETAETEAGYKINKSIPAGVTPLRITQTPYWIEKHRNIDDRIWKNPVVGWKANCRACHRDADYGTFEDAAMRLPK